MSPQSVVIQGRTLTFPIEVRRASQVLVTYTVEAEAAQRLITATGLEVAEPRAGRAIVSLAYVRYDEGDLDAYDELGVAVLVRRHDAGPATARERAAEVRKYGTGVYIHHLPVNQSFTLEAGRTIWGYPKFLADFEVTRGRRTVCRLSHAGAHVLTLSVRRGGLPLPKQRAIPTYTLLDGVLRVTPWELEIGGVRGWIGGARLELGDHPIADELRGLGLPKRALLSSHVASFRARFGESEILGSRAAAGAGSLSSVSSEEEEPRPAAKQ
jgi:hypothetical protein